MGNSSRKRQTASLANQVCDDMIPVFSYFKLPYELRHMILSLCDAELLTTMRNLNQAIRTEVDEYSLLHRYFKIDWVDNIVLPYFSGFIRMENRNVARTHRAYETVRFVTANKIPRQYNNFRFPAKVLDLDLIRNAQNLEIYNTPVQFGRSGWPSQCQERSMCSISDGGHSLTCSLRLLFPKLRKLGVKTGKTWSTRTVMYHVDWDKQEPFQQTDSDWQNIPLANITSIGGPLGFVHDLHLIRNLANLEEHIVKARKHEIVAQPSDTSRQSNRERCSSQVVIQRFQRYNARLAKTSKRREHIVRRVKEVVGSRYSAKSLDFGVRLQEQLEKCLVYHDVQSCDILKDRNWAKYLRQCIPYTRKCHRHPSPVALLDMVFEGSLSPRVHEQGEGYKWNDQSLSWQTIPSHCMKIIRKEASCLR